jgi:cytochrome oxidase Cu insertion factor (SCO1/SenC/PrrC family)
MYPWLFLTGELSAIQAAGKSFAVNVDGQTHSTGLLLVDKWGRFRDRFSWEDAKDVQRMREVVRQVAAETQAPFGQRVSTKAVPRVTEDEDEIVYAHGDWNRPGELLTGFLLTERSGRRVSSQSLLGKVWLGSFFFSKCPSICKQQNLEIGRVAEKLRELDLTFVSITSDPQYDTPLVLREYAQQFNADPQRWLFLTGEQLHIERIGAEMFGVGVAKEQHSTKLMLVDRWGNVRGRYRWQDEDEMKEFRIKVDKVLHEKSPPSPAELEAESAAAPAAEPDDGAENVE